MLGASGITMSLMHTMIVPLLPEISTILRISQSSASWLLTVTMLAGAVSAPVLGRLGDMVGKRRMLAVALAMMATGSLLGAVSTSYSTLLAGRMLQGAAFGVLPLGISIMNDQLPPRRVVGGTAVMSSTLGVGGAVGLPLSGVIAELGGWHAVFWTATGASSIALLLVIWLVPESPVRSPGRFDLPGAVGLGAGLVSLLVAISYGSRWGWGSLPTVALFATAFLVLLGWGWYQLRVRAPLVDLRTSARPVVLLTNLATLLVGVAMFASFMLTPMLLQAPTETGYGFGATILVSGLCMLPSGLGMLLFSPVSARLSAARGAHVTLLCGTVVMAVANGLQATLPRSIPTLVPVLLVLSIGTALSFSAMPTLIMSAVPVTETASANGLNALVRTIGTSSCAAVAGTFLATFTVRTADGVLPSATGYRLGFLVAAGSALLAGLLAAAVGVVVRARSRGGARHENAGQDIDPSVRSRHGDAGRGRSRPRGGDRVGGDQGDDVARRPQAVRATRLRRGSPAGHRGRLRSQPGAAGEVLR